MVPGVIVVAICMSFAGLRPAAVPGDLDAGFGDGGIVQDVFGSGVALQGAKIVVGGTGTVPGTALMEAARLLPDGTLDPAFGIDGRALARFAGDAYGEDVAVHPGGKVVVAGTRTLDDPYRSVVAVVRFRADGALDDTFSSDGRATTSFPGYAEGKALALQSDGKVVVAGTDGPHFIVVRYLRTGALDPAFGVGGRVTTVLPGDPGNAVAEDLAIDADGRIVVVGTLSWRTLVVARYRPNGTLDPTFGRGDGLKFTGGTAKSGNAVALQADGKIVAGGLEEEWNHDTGELDSFHIVTRYTSDGRPDAAFGVIRLASDPLGSASWGILDVGLAPDGKIVAVGSNMMLARLLPDGSPDPSFGGGDGIVLTPFGGVGLAIQSDGGVLVVGEGVARFLA